MIPVVVQAKKNPLDHSSVKYYIQVAPAVPVSFEGIAKNISDRCTLTEADVLAVLNALQTEIVSAVQSGHSVRLGQLGSFRATITSLGADSKAEADSSLIKALRVRFTMGSRLRSAMRLTNTDVKFVKKSN